MLTSALSINLHGYFPIDCVSTDETAAEKWVALTRRVSNTDIKSRQSDIHLVRHLYDLYSLSQKKLLQGDYESAVKNIIEKDRIQFKRLNKNYYANPIKASEQALSDLFEKHKWREHWHRFLEQMVYEEDKPSFEQAYKHLEKISRNIFYNIKTDKL